MEWPRRFPNSASQIQLAIPRPRGFAPRATSTCPHPTPAAIRGKGGQRPAGDMETCHPWRGDAERGVFVIEGPWKREGPVNLLRRQFLQVAVGAAALPTSSRFAWAQAYPARPVRMIVPFGPGGNADVFGRIIAQKVSEQIGKQFYERTSAVPAAH